MKKIISRSVLFFIIAYTMMAVLNGCAKAAIEAVQQTALEKQFEDNILNQNFRVKLATDNGTDLSSQYTGYTFRLLKSTTYNGAMTAEKNAVTYTGNWSCNDDFSKLVISLPALPVEFIFLSREWKFTKKALPVMELAPWGTLEPKILHMERF